MENQGNLPVKKFRAGGITATVWNNTSKDGENEFKSIVLERSYKDNAGAWKTTSSLRANDLPKASLVLRKAYEYVTLSGVEA